MMVKKKSSAIGLIALFIGGAAVVTAIVLSRAKGDGNGVPDNGVPDNGVPVVGSPCSPEGFTTTKFCPETNQTKPVLICQNGLWEDIERACPTPSCVGGDVRRQRCPDGSLVVTEMCVSGRLQPTGNQCPPSGIPENFIELTVVGPGDISISWFDQITRNLDGNLTPPASFMNVLGVHFALGEINQLQKDEAIRQFIALGF